MRWLIFLLLCLGLLIYPVAEVYAATSLDITVTAKPNYGVGAPSQLQLTYVNDHEMLIEWVKHDTANNTMIRASFNDYPTSVTDGYLIYYGTEDSFSDTSINWYDNAGTIYVFAISDNYSGTENASWEYSSYITASLENPIVADVAIAIEGITSFLTNNLSDIIGLVIVISLAVLASWRGNRPLYMLSGFAFIIYGFNYWTRATYLSILLVIAGIFMVLRSLVKKRENEGG